MEKDIIQTLLTRNDLCKRWGVDYSTIAKYEEDGILTRNPHFPSPRYYLEEVEKIDKYKPSPLSPFEFKRIEKENYELRRALDKATEQLIQQAALGTECMSTLNQIFVQTDNKNIKSCV